jgi:hypothetical protein
MERTPLVDFFRRGEVDRDVRLLAAQGALAPRAHEQLALLMLLVDDRDPDIARAAEATLQVIPRESLAAFLARSDVSTELKNFFAARGIEQAPAPLEGTADEPLIDMAPEPPALPALEIDLPDLPEAAAAPPAIEPLPEPAPELPPLDLLPELEPIPELPPEDPEAKKFGTVEKIAKMTVAQRMGLAMKGTREERAILIRDPNKIVSVAVLSSPKVTEQEIESFAKMANVSDEILRIIGQTRAWSKNYMVALALAKNPKTPVAISMNILGRLSEKDLRGISTDRNVPEVLRLTARKKIVLDK